jgi:dihydroorotate dehydrogenase
MYKFIYRVFLTKLDAELAHHLGMFMLKVLSALGLTKVIARSKTETLEVMGLKFKGPFGMAAGFDKNAVAIKALGELGFSHVEVGTVTAVAQPGNDKPRLFRLVADRALINRMGFNNEGAVAVAARLAKTRKRYGNKLPVIGVNIGKSRVVDVDQAVADYETSARLLAPHADYLAVNVSSPNTPGLRSLQNVESLAPILEVVKSQASGKPVLVKIAPDLADEDVIAVADLVKTLGIAGVIATNTTISRSNLRSAAAAAAETGGLSGAPLKARSIEVLKLLRKHLPKESVIISVGGVETAAEVKQRMELGANLVQGYTGFIYEGPLWAKHILRKL